MVIVLETAGKHESVDFAKVLIFDDVKEANAFIGDVCTGKQKHWRHAQIVEDCEEIELMQPQDE